MKSRNLIIALGVLLVGVFLTTWWLNRPKKITQDFASHLSQERYEACAEMLRPPSAIQVSPDGDLLLTDHRGNSVTVRATKLPFKVGGGQPDSPSDFSMIALGKDTNGVLDTPAVILYLSIEGGKVIIDRVDS